MFIFIAAYLQIALCGTIVIQPNCADRFPDLEECKRKNWDLGNITDPCRPKKLPEIGQQVYIQDPLNFCINLPDPDSEHLKKTIYSKGLKPTILQGEGYVRSFCMGSYLSPGSLNINPKGIKSAHVIINEYNGKKYIEISGKMDCKELGISCRNKPPFDDGGQYDSVSYRHCGKEPYSGVDKSKNPKLESYVEQAGNGIFCMRVCEYGLGLDDPCNAKFDELGCHATMNITTFNVPGFTLTNKITNETRTFTPGEKNNVLNTDTAATITSTETKESHLPTSGAIYSLNIVFVLLCFIF
jgi:hypothetical protein